MMAEQPLTGWLGHENPFAFDTDYRPAEGIRRHVCSSPGVLGLVAFELFALGEELFFRVVATLFKGIARGGERIFLSVTL